MRRYLPRLAMIAGLALALTACGSTTGATDRWVDAVLLRRPPAELRSPPLRRPSRSPAHAEKISIEAFDLGFTPAMAFGCRRPARTRSSSRTPAPPSMTSPLRTVRSSAPRVGRARPARSRSPCRWTCLRLLNPGPRRCGNEGRSHGRGSGSRSNARSQSPGGRQRPPSRDRSAEAIVPRWPTSTVRVGPPSARRWRAWSACRAMTCVVFVHAGAGSEGIVGSSHRRRHGRREGRLPPRSSPPPPRSGRGSRVSAAGGPRLADRSPPPFESVHAANSRAMMSPSCCPGR